MVAGCRTSGVLPASALVNSGKCKLVSIHAYNSHGGNASTITVYDNTAASGTAVAKLYLPAQNGSGLDGAGDATQEVIGNNPIEFDMHGVICENGLYCEISGGTVGVTVEFA